jgi:hypothetical protein
MPRYAIAPDASARTTRCHCNHECLQDAPPIRFCQLEAFADGKLLFITEPKGNGCHYKVLFGDRAFCGCPVRRAIFEKYHV